MVNQVAVIGAGLLGRGIASVLARHSFTVTMFDASAQTLADACGAVARLVPAALPISAAATLEQAVAEADVVIEAVSENLSLKQQLFARMSEANSRAILMSNSSVLPIGQIALHARNPSRAVGTHWWNPPDLIPVVEVIRGPQTSEEVMTRASHFLAQIGKLPVRVSRDVPGFIGNRLQHALWREAIGLAAQGTADVAMIDRIVSSTLGASLAQRGPIAEMNRLAVNVLTDQFTTVLPTLVNEQAPSALLKSKVAAGELGAKSGSGFFQWPEGRREQRAGQLQEQVKMRLAAGAVSAPKFQGGKRPASGIEALIAARLQTALWREALSLIEDGVCDGPTVDLMVCNTIGLRLAVMAPLENADYVGLDLTLAIHQAVLPSLSVRIDVPPLYLLAQSKLSRST